MEPTNLFSSEMLYNFARGPLVWISFIIFFLGSIIQIVKLFLLTRNKESIKLNLKSDDKKDSSLEPQGGSLAHLIAKLKLTIIGVSPVTIAITVIFHVLLFMVPVFLLAHNILLDNAWGISFFAFSEHFADILTIIFFACVLFFLYRRIFVARVRAITSFYDYYILFLATVPFLTGFFAYHQIFDYRTVIILHMLLGELMLISIPFTKIIHMFFFFIFRFFVVNEYTLGKGNRTWK